MLINIILYGSAYITVPIMCACMLMAAKGDKDLVLGVRIPKEHLMDHEILDAIRGYKKEIWIITAIVGVFPIPACFIRGFTISMTVWMLWLTVAIAGYIFPYTKYNKRIRGIKLLRGWEIPEVMRSAVEALSAEAEADSYADREKYKYGRWFVPAAIISVIPFVIIVVSGFVSEDTEMLIGKGITVGSIALVTATMYIASVIIRHIRREIISLDGSINKIYNQLRIESWNRYFIVMAYLNAAFTWIMYLCMSKESYLVAGMVAGSFIYIIVAVIYAFIIEKKIVAKRMELKAGALEFTGMDDDEHWIGGMLYYNPNDKSTVVEKRIGIGTTINLATKTGKALIVFTLLCLLSMPAILVFIGLDEYTPISYKYENQQLVFSHVMTRYVIEEDNIEKVELIDQLPKRSRVNGTGLENLEKGAFSVNGYGKCKLCLDPQNGEFLVITTKDDLIYIFSARDDSSTLELYRMISNKITAPAY